MKISIKLMATALLLTLGWGVANAQDKDDDEKVVVLINVDGKEQELDEYFEEWGERLGDKIERMFDDKKVTIRFDEYEFEEKMEHLGDRIEDMAERLAETIEDVVTNMTIEVYNIDREDIGAHEVCFDDNNGDLEDLIKDIEQKYRSKVEKIDKLKVKIRKDYVKIDLDATLENGKNVSKTRIYPH